MPTRHPVNFEEKVRLPKGNNGGDYPYAIKAQDLMKNFVYAALDADETLVETVSGEKGYTQRRLRIPAVPGGGTFVLGSVGGSLTWIETEACDAEPE
jgi:hypothetical protein